MSHIQAPEDDNVSRIPAHEDEEPESEPEPSVREGLPRGYRMRADPHYVEQLGARSVVPIIESTSVSTIAFGYGQVPEVDPVLVESVRRYGILQPLLVQRRNGVIRLIDGRKRLQAAVIAGLREVPCLAHDIDDSACLAVAQAANIVQPQGCGVPCSTPLPSVVDIHDALVDSLTEMQSATQLLVASTSSRSQNVGGDLIRAEVVRVSCLVDGSRILQHGVPNGQVATSARQLVASVVERLEAERRLRGYILHSECEIPESYLIAGDPVVLATVLSGLMLATWATVDGRPGARMGLTASVDAARQVKFVVSEMGVGVSTHWESRAFDPTWGDRPGGVPAVVWMLAARKVAESYGGGIEVSATTRGATATMTMPVAA
jgi:hypothetical protein